ncbi:MAG: hypothetical protein FJ087_12260 [Deltaproteobacteria bacterium]|nr:hypothetical protein [Deltaproteobacteria bacterium]
MHVRFVTQPFSDGFDLRDFLEAGLGDGIDEILVVVAWVKRSGIEVLSDALVRFRKRGGRATLLVGISSGGATLERLSDGSFRLIIDRGPTGECR